MNVFLTGATGFLGSRVAAALIREGAHLKALRRNFSRLDLLDIPERRISWVIGDLSEPGILLEGMDGMDAVIHCAGHLGFEGRNSQERLLDVNVDGTAMIVDCAIQSGIPRMVHISSIAALGRSSRQEAMLDETARWESSRFNSVYARSKHLAESEVQRGVAEGLDAVIVSPSLIMGPGRKGENTMQIAERLRKGTVPFVPSGGTNVVDVEDVATGILAALARGKTGQRYILGGENLSWKDILVTLSESLEVVPPTRSLPPRLAVFFAALFEAGARLTGRRPIITRETARVSSSRVWYDTSLAQNELEWTPRPFAETADRIAEAIRRNELE